MKKEMIDYVKKLGGVAIYQGSWPATLYVDHKVNGKEWIKDQMIKKFTRHTKIRFA